MPNIVSVPVSMTSEVQLWMGRVNANGGGMEWNSAGIANQFIRALRGKSYYQKIMYLLPMLGRGIGAARVPLIDVLNVGSATNNNFVDADFSQRTGLQGNGSTKYLNLLIKPSQTGSGGNGGLGYWVMSLSNTANVMGAQFSGAEQYNIYFDISTPREVFYWGTAAIRVDTSNSPTVSHYLCQRNTSAVSMYKNGSLYSNSAGTSTITNISSVGNMYLMSSNNTSSFSNGRCGLAYITDGTMSVTEISDFHTLLSDYLMRPSGKT